MINSNNYIESDFIFSMVNKRKHQTGLPVNIWIDVAEWYKKGRHDKRIKFQLDYSNRITDNCACMKLNGDVVIDTMLNKDIQIRKRDIDAVSIFVQNNSYALEMLSDQKIYEEDFEEVMIKGRKPATKEMLLELKTIVDEMVEYRNN